MKYFVNFQQLHAGSRRPSDDGSVFGGDEYGPGNVPAVGDFVLIHETDHNPKIEGRVRSRLYNYIEVAGERHCHINIVVEETSDDWGLLIKE